MRNIRIFGFLILISGIALMLISNYINTRVVEGRGQVESAQKQVDQSSSLFSLHPATKEIGKGFTGSAQEKINAGQQEVGYYANLANWLWILGIILIVIGAVIVLITFIRRKK